MSRLPNLPVSSALLLILKSCAVQPPSTVRRGTHGFRDAAAEALRRDFFIQHLRRDAQQ